MEEKNIGLTEQELQVISFKQRTADKVAKFGGSWTFIMSFILFCIGWVSINLCFYAFDSYPFILLNLILSCLSVFQAPFILMAQNRQSEIDRIRAEDDYKVDVLAESEIKEIKETLNIIISKIKEM